VFKGKYEHDLTPSRSRSFESTEPQRKERREQ
jgi:hypothetical protein